MTCSLGSAGMELEGRHVVVTGAASGIGRAVALRFADEGARAVVVADLDKAGADAVAAEVSGLAVRADVGREEDIRALVARAEAANGPVDLFVSNAGITGPSGGPELLDADWDLLWRGNTMSHGGGARGLPPGMLAGPGACGWASAGRRWRAAGRGAPRRIASAAAARSALTTSGPAPTPAMSACAATRSAGAPVARSTRTAARCAAARSAPSSSW